MDHLCIYHNRDHLQVAEVVVYRGQHMGHLSCKNHYIKDEKTGMLKMESRIQLFCSKDYVSLSKSISEVEIQCFLMIF